VNREVVDMFWIKRWRLILKCGEYGEMREHRPELKEKETLQKFIDFRRRVPMGDK
jgi:hypothetical protein